MIDTSAVLKERGEVYGEFADIAGTSQELKSTMSGEYPPVMAEAIEMICSKLSRIKNGDPYHKDNWVDIAGYAQLVVQWMCGR